MRGGVVLAALLCQLVWGGDGDGATCIAAENGKWGVQVKLKL